MTGHDDLRASGGRVTARLRDNQKPRDYETTPDCFPQFSNDGTGIGLVEIRRLTRIAATGNLLNDASRFHVDRKIELFCVCWIFLFSFFLLSSDFLENVENL